jgi:hypothetical protein
MCTRVVRATMSRPNRTAFKILSLDLAFGKTKNKATAE